MYNTVSVQRLSPCARCGSVQQVELQFHHGREELRRYEIGDFLEFDEGVTPEDETEIWGYLQVCEQCGFTRGELQDYPYVIRIWRGRIVGARLSAPDDFDRIGPY
jgi:hypothetical protein